MPKPSSRPLSIATFVNIEAKRLAIRIFLYGFGITFSLGILLGIWHHYNDANFVIELTKRSLTQPLTLGGSYIPKRILSGLLSSGRFSDALLVHSDGTTILSESTPKGSQLDLREQKTFYLRGIFPHFTIEKEIIVQEKSIATMYLGYQLPVLSVLVLAVVLSLIFSVLAIYLKRSIERMAEDGVSPLIRFTTFLKGNLNKDNFLSKRNWQYEEIDLLHGTLSDYFLKLREAEAIARKAISQAQVSKIASRVKHDVKASLFIGESLLKKKENQGALSDIGVLKSIFERIHHTIEDIPKSGALTHSEISAIVEGEPNPTEGRSFSDRLRSCHVLSLIRQVISEVKYAEWCTRKKIQFSVDYEPDDFDIFAEVQTARFNAMLVNLYKNASEAIKDVGTIKTILRRKESGIELLVKDDGVGISEDRLRQIGKPGASFKADGMGLGLVSAMEYVRNWEGTLVIDSTLGVGTTIKIWLPEGEENFLYPTQITLTPNSEVLSVDDDASIASLWHERFSNVGAKEQNIHYYPLSSLSAARSWVRKRIRNGRDFFVLADNDLGTESSGVEFVKELQIQDRTVLVSSHGTSSRLYDQCEKIGLPILPKVIQDEVPIVIAREEQSRNARH